MRLVLHPADESLSESLAEQGLEVVDEPGPPAEGVALVLVDGDDGWEEVWRHRRAGRGVVVVGAVQVVARALDLGLEAALEPVVPALVPALARAALRRRFLPFYERFVELTGDSVEISDTEVHLTRVNPAFEAHSGYPADAAIGRTPKELFRTGHQSSAHFAAVNAAVDQGEVWAGEVVDRRADGGLAIVYTKVSAVQEDGRRIGYLVTKSQVGDASDASADAERRTRALVEAAGDAVFVITPDGQIADLNHAGGLLLGADRDPSLTGSLFERLEGRTAVEWRGLLAELPEGRARTVESAIVVDGHEVPLELRLSRTEVAMEGLVLVLARDIRERKAAERTLKSLNRKLQTLNQGLEEQVAERTRALDATAQSLSLVLDNAADGLLGLDQRGAVTVANPAATRLLGLDDTVTGGSPIPEALLDAIDDCLAAVEEQRIELPLSEERVGVAVVSPVRERGGRVSGCVVVLRDVTLEREIDRMKTDFITTVSHELRTPLTSVLGFAKLARLRFDERVLPHVGDDSERTRKAVAQVQDNLDIIVQEGTRLTTLINDVLDISKMESGRVEWRREIVDLKELVQEAVDATGALFADGDVALVVEADVPTPSVVGDRHRLIRVAINLLSNARKFTPEGEVRIRLLATDTEAGFEVRDTGVGIPAAEHEAVFDRFQQLGDMMTSKPRGTGLGLPICKQIVDAHGGRITVRSRVGRGATFTVLLPLAASEDGPTLQG